MSVNDRDERQNREKNTSWLAENKIWIAVITILVLLIILLLVVLFKKDKKDEPAPAKEPDAVPAAVSDIGQGVLGDLEISNELEEDAYLGINVLIQTYYECMAAGDVEGVRAVVDVLSESQENYIQSLETLIEEYQNIHCYTKRGMEEGSFVVFTCYDLKFVAADTVSPGMETFYVKTNESDAYYIYLDTPSEELLAYVNDIGQGEDVQALYNDVWERFETAQQADSKLAEYGAKLEQLKNKSEEGSETPAEETPEETPSEETPEEQPQQNEAAPSGDGTDVNRETHFTDTTNIRSDRSTDSDRVALGYQGESVTQITEYSDGWSKVRYNGKEGYCKTEYLEKEGGSASAPSGGGTAVNKETHFNSTTNVRSERNTNSARVALGYQGEAVTRIEDYSDGWSKVRYNGKEGYCKTEYLD